jgi:hypothetical protein
MLTCMSNNIDAQANLDAALVDIVKTITEWRQGTYHSARAENLAMDIALLSTQVTTWAATITALSRTHPRIPTDHNIAVTEQMLRALRNAGPGWKIALHTGDDGYYLSIDGPDEDPLVCGHGHDVVRWGNIKHIFPVKDGQLTELCDLYTQEVLKIIS